MKLSWRDKLSHKILILVFLPLAFELVFITCLDQWLKQVEVEAIESEKSKEIITATEKIGKLVYDGGMALMCFMQTDAPVWATSYMSACDQMRATVKTLKVLVRDNPEEAQSAQIIEQNENTHLARLAQIKQALDDGERMKAMFLTNEITQHHGLPAMATEMQRIVSKEMAKQTTPEEAARQRQFVRTSLVGLLGMSIVVAVVLALTLGRAITARLNTLMDNTRKLSRKEPLNPSLTGNDEVAELDHVFRVMASKLQEASRKERAVIDNAVDVICSIDADNKFSKVNPAAVQLWGYNPDVLIGKNALDLVFDEDRQKTKKSFLEIIAKATGSFENRIKRSDNLIADMRWSVQWSQSEKSLFCVVHDVTDRKQMERMKQEFVAMVSHDLRSPLSSIKMTLELLANGTYGALSDKGQTRVNSADNSARRLIKLVSDILDIEKMETGGMDLHKEITLTSILIDRSIEAIRSVAEEKSIHFAKSDEDFELLADGDRLTQVLVNLLANAIKFSPAQSEIAIEAHREDAWIVLTVTDQGRGVPQEKRDLIFERFKQVDRSDAKEKGGTGLGLAICKAIIEAHGGMIGVTSEEGSGSTFWIRLQHAL